MTPRALILITLVLVMSAACAPSTPIRRSALVSAPTLPSRSGLPLEEGEVRVTGELNPLRMSDGWWNSTTVPPVGAPGLYVPVIQLGASIYGSPIEGLEFGGQLRYSRFEWSEANAVGVLAFPDRSKDIFTGGFGLRGNIKLAQGLHLNLMGELNLSEVEQAVFVCYACIDGGVGTYEFERYDSTIFILPSLATGLSYRFNDYVGVFSTLGFALGVKNVGFDSNIKNLDKDSLSMMSIFPIGGGVEVTVSHFVGSVALFYPLDTVAHVDFGPSLSARLGARF